MEDETKIQKAINAINSGKSSAEINGLSLVALGCKYYEDEEGDAYIIVDGVSLNAPDLTESIDSLLGALPEGAVRAVYPVEFPDCIKWTVHIFSKGKNNKYLRLVSSAERCKTEQEATLLALLKAMEKWQQ